MWELDQKEDWAPKNWCFSTVVLEKALESPMDFKEIQPVNPKQNQVWTFIGRTGTGAEAPVLWPQDLKSWLIRKDPDAGTLKSGGEGNDRGWDGWMASLTPWTWVEQALGDGEGQGSLVCCSPWGRVESDTTEGLNNNNRDKWRGHQQQFRILQQRAERARGGGSGRSQIMKASMALYEV